MKHKEPLLCPEISHIYKGKKKEICNAKILLVISDVRYIVLLLYETNL
jgi:hypothetical protein